MKKTLALIFAVMMMVACFAGCKNEEKTIVVGYTDYAPMNYLDENGKYVERDVYFYDNPVSLLNETQGMTRSRNVRFTGSVTYKPTSDLTLKAMYTRKGQSYLNGYYYSTEPSLERSTSKKVFSSS